MIDNRQVGRKIAAMRQKRALTQQQLAAMMNVSHQAVSKWESGQALPDIQTMLELTRFFGITVEQLISSVEAESEMEKNENVYEDEESSDNKHEDKPKAEQAEREASNMNIHQLLQMAPYMSRETVEEIVMEMEGELNAQQIARIAPFIRPECVEKLIEKHHPELSWEALRRIAPYMRKEAVDELARAIADGRETVKPAGENINKTFNDIGKAVDDIGRGVGKAVKKAIRFGETVIDGISSAINELSDETGGNVNSNVRTGRAAQLRKMAFERALEDGKWDWLEAHIQEMDSDADFKTRAAQKAREQGKHDWICRNLGAYADQETIEAAIESGNWAWIGKNVRELDAQLQEKAALAAMKAENWVWLIAHSDHMKLDGCAYDIAEAALRKGACKLAVRLAENHMDPSQQAKLIETAYDEKNDEAVDELFWLVTDEYAAALMLKMAEKGDWQIIEKHAASVGSPVIETLMEAAVSQGNFEAVDLLDDYL